VNTPLRIDITEKAQTQIAVASAWWAEHRPAAPGHLATSSTASLDSCGYNRKSEQLRPCHVVRGATSDALSDLDLHRGFVAEGWWDTLLKDVEAQTRGV
jgi:hypothetical protein